MFNWKAKAVNAIYLDENVGGKGKYFKSRFLQPGLVKYSFGVCVLDKGTIDKFIQNFVGCPVIINHKDVTEESAKDDRVGAISRVWYDEQDGWYWGEGVIFDDEALNLIDSGYNVSCQYEITEYAENKTKALHNGNEYDKIILNGKPEHLAIVKNPRYENAMIAVNAIEIEAVNEDKKEFVTVGEGESAHAIPVDYMKKDKKEEKSDKEEKKIELKDHEKKLLKDGNTYAFAELLAKHYPKEAKEIGLTKNGELGYVNSYKKYIEFDKHNNQFVVWHDNGDKSFFDTNFHNVGHKAYNDMDKIKNNIVQAINEIKESGMFNLFKKKEINMDKDELKALFVECLNEFTATNAKDDEVKDEVKEEVVENEEEKVEEIEEEVEKADAENKCAKNEEPDYKALYEELLAKNAEKDEEKVEELKEEVDKEVAKNDIDTSAFFTGKEQVKSSFITQAEAIKLGEELY